mmetsp:Transcript_17119/g.65324  ORF Transcript_17119/g.65324 Transcript_17119/m.65324 type:complete len:308 (-) Transcript_17119:56-979(-)
MRFSKRRRMAASISQGTFVAASTSTPEGPPPTPCRGRKRCCEILRARRPSVPRRDGFIESYLHLHEELRLDPPGGLGLALRALRSQRVDLVNEHDGRRLLLGHLEEVAHELLRLALPLAHEVGGAHGEEGGVRLGRHRLGQVRLARTGRSVQQDAAPGLPFPHEEVREARGQDDGLLQGLLGRVQARHILPADIGLLGHDGTAQGRLQALRFVVLLGGVLFLGHGRAALGRRGVGRLLAVQHGLEVLRALHVAHHALRHGLAHRGVLLILQGVDEVVQGLLVQHQRALVLLLVVRFHRLLHQLDPAR